MRSLVFHPVATLRILATPARLLYGPRLLVPVAFLSLLAGFNAAAVSQALKRPWPAVERAIAEHLGIPPWTLWPERYEGRQPIYGRAA